MGSLAGIASAKPQLSPIRQGQANTVDKIAHGTASGQLTAGEAGKAMEGVHKLASAAHAAHADGKVTFGEATKLGSMKANNANMVQDLKHNNNTNSFAPFSPAAQNQAKQLHGLSEAMQQPGVVSNKELRGAMNEQGAIANERAGGGAGGGAAKGPQAQGASEVGPIRQGQANTVGKIAQGTSSGQLTAGEAGKAMEGVHKLASAAHAAHADGNVTFGEAVKLGSMKANNADMVKDLKHNDKTNSFAPFSPMAQNQAKQLQGLSNSMQQPGVISNKEVRGAMNQQGAIANERSDMNSLGDAAKVLQDQKVSGLSLQLSRLSSGC